MKSSAQEGRAKRIGRVVCFWAALSAGAGVLLSVTVTARQDRRFSAASSQTAGGRRVALLVGNDAYAEARLVNAVNDARALGAALQQVGFDVRVAVNAGLREMSRSIDTFVGELRPGDVALFYYSGHGFQLDGDNYLVPIDFTAPDAEDAKYQAYSATRVQARMAGAKAGLTILVLDACRNNPFRGIRSAGGGWAGMQAGRGSYIAFATAPGETASDNPGGGNGLFTTHLLQALRTPGLTLDQVFGEVGRRVRQASGDRQDPWIAASAGAGSQFVFVPLAATPGRGSTETAELALRTELALWDSIKDSRDRTLFEDYLRQYPNGRFSAVARGRLGGPATLASPAIDEARVRAFWEGYTNDLVRHNLDAIVARYADRVVYFESGIVDRQVIRRDKQAYLKRWPEIRNSLVGPITVRPGATPDTAVIEFSIDYSVRSQVRGESVSGIARNRWTLADRGGSLIIIGEQQAVTSRVRSR